MDVKRIGKKTRISFSYFEWVSAGKKLPPHELVEGNVEYIINQVPHDREEFFKQFKWNVRLSVNKGIGMRKW